MIVIIISFQFAFKGPKMQVDSPKPEAWKINQGRKCEFHTVLLYGCLAMYRLALIITYPSLLFRSPQLLSLPCKPLIWIGVKPALIADPYHNQAHHPSNSVCSLRFVNCLLCFASLNWCLRVHGSLSHSLLKKAPIKSNRNLIQEGNGNG